MKSSLALLSLFGLSLSTLSFAANCPELNLEGKWQNGWGNQFEINQPSCDVIAVRDLSTHNNFSNLHLDGKSEVTFDGSTIKNAHSMVNWFSKNGQTEKIRKPLVQSWGISGKLEENSDMYQSRSKSGINSLITTKFLLPVPGTNDYFSLQGTVQANISLYKSSSNEELLAISLRNARVTALNEKSNGAFIRGFLTGINALLNLFDSYYVSNKDGYLSGSRVLHDIDYNSLTLRKVK